LTTRASGCRDSANTVSHNRVLERELVVKESRSKVFEFFADAANLEQMTPSAIKFRMLTPRPIEMKRGTLIDYQIRLFGIPFPWRTLIESFEPETRFVDIQLKGPYSLWRHTHSFEDRPGGTLVRDHVEYSLPLGPLGDVAHALFVERQLRQIFDYRRQVMAERFGVL
jgi:ligand-binding SRPBCC domain-containing protein